MSIVDRVRELVAPIVSDAGADLYDVEFNGSVLRVLVDRNDGIDVGAISSISRRVARALDALDTVPGRYTLEVSSPGLERPLRSAEHFARALGEQVTVKTREPIDGRRRFDGELTASSDHGIEVLTAQGVLSLDHGQIAKARTVFSWDPAARRPAGSSSRAPQSPASRSAAHRCSPGRASADQADSTRGAARQSPASPGRPHASRSDARRSKESES